MIRVDLTPCNPHQQSPRAVYLRELSGYDELCDDSATSLIDRLLVEQPGSAVLTGAARHLTLSDTDRVLTAIYRTLYGDEAECHVTCATCSRVYSMSFTLTALWEHVTQTGPEDEPIFRDLRGPDDDGVYRLGRLRFRLPTPNDLAQAPASEQALRARCVIEEDAACSEETLDRALALVGPTLDADIDSICSECGAEHAIPFRIDEFLLAALARERTLLTREIHEIARSYRWSRREILEIPRRERRQYAALVIPDSASGAWA